MTRICGEQTHRDQVVGFGKYRGRRLAEMPTGWLRWSVRHYPAGPLARWFDIELADREDGLVVQEPVDGWQPCPRCGGAPKLTVKGPDSVLSCDSCQRFHVIVGADDDDNARRSLWNSRTQIWEADQ